VPKKLRAVKFALLLAAALSSLYALAAVNLHSTLQDKALEQGRANAGIARLKQQYEALLPTQQQWQRAFPDADAVRDVFALYRLFDFDAAGLTVNPDTLIVSGLERVTADGVDVGLTRVCAISGGGTGVIATAPSYAELLAGVRALAARAAVRMDGITLEHVAAGPRVQMHRLCLLVRDTEAVR
jgi:hypothetical protein